MPRWQVDAHEECDPFTMISSALSVNVGTALSPHWVQAMIHSAEAAAKHQKPWSFDPVRTVPVNEQWTPMRFQFG